MTDQQAGLLPQVRRATVADAAALAQIATATFTETFGHLYPRQDLQAYLAKFDVHHCREQLVDQNTVVWFASFGHESPAGFVLAGRCNLPLDMVAAQAGEVRQLYVYSKYQNRGVGVCLMDAARNWLAAEGYAPVYIGVWSENFGAQRFYARYGFSRVGEYGFPVGNTVDREFILKR